MKARFYGFTTNANIVLIATLDNPTLGELGLPINETEIQSLAEMAEDKLNYESFVTDARGILVLNDSDLYRFIDRSKELLGTPIV